jgi:hypothetical protein
VKPAKLKLATEWIAANRTMLRLRYLSEVFVLGGLRGAASDHSGRGDDY